MMNMEERGLSRDRERERAKDATLQIEESSAYANSNLETFLHHTEDLSSWWMQADWMLMKTYSFVESI